MSFSIRILPSNHTYSVEPQETLLEGALRSGIHLSYSCGSGSCGECKARLLEGRLGQTDSHDYVFRTFEKSDDKMLLCRTHAASDLVIEALEANGPQDIPLQSIKTRVSRIERLEDTYLILHLRTPRSKTLRFLAGQHVQLRLNSSLARDFSIASCPCNGMLLQFHIRYEEDDPFSWYIFNELAQSDAVEIVGPFGDFTLNEESSRPIVMVAYEEAIAPIKSLIEQAINLEVSQQLSLYWIASSSDGHYLDNYCRSWQEALDNYSYHPLLLPSDMSLKDGVISLSQKICEGLSKLEEADLYLAGPAFFQALMKRLFIAAGVPEPHIFTVQIRDERREEKRSELAN